jgi:iron-sulfur cluster insertion protein
MIKISVNAKQKMVDVLADANASILRFGLKGGGCSGMQYFFSTETAKDVDDTVYNINDTYILVVDPTSIMYLVGAEIDFKKDIMGEKFIFINPLMTSTCGCGSSVSPD